MPPSTVPTATKPGPTVGQVVTSAGSSWLQRAAPLRALKAYSVEAAPTKIVPLEYTGGELVGSPVISSDQALRPVALLRQ